MSNIWDKSAFSPSVSVSYRANRVPWSKKHRANAIGHIWEIHHDGCFGFWVTVQELHYKDSYTYRPSTWTNLLFPISDSWVCHIGPPESVGQINAEQAKVQLQTHLLSSLLLSALYLLTFSTYYSDEWAQRKPVYDYSEMKRVAFRPGDTVLKSQPFAFVIIASHRYCSQVWYVDVMANTNTRSTVCEYCWGSIEREDASPCRSCR